MGGFQLLYPQSTSPWKGDGVFPFSKSKKKKQKPWGPLIGDALLYTVNA